MMQLVVANFNIAEKEKLERELLSVLYEHGFTSAGLSAAPVFIADIEFVVEESLDTDKPRVLYVTISTIDWKRVMRTVFMPSESEVVNSIRKVLEEHFGRTVRINNVRAWALIPMWMR